MITKTALENIVSKQRKMLANVSPGHPREIEESIPYLTDRMLLIGGVRGCGCSALLHRMLNNDYPEAWYTDFDDPRLGGFDAGDFTKLDRLLEAGHQVDVDRVHALALASTALYKQHLMAALTDEPYASDAYQGLYRSLFKGEGICARDIEYVDACEYLE
mgnify:CR=1 FL=1